MHKLMTILYQEKIKFKDVSKQCLIFLQGPDKISKIISASVSWAGCDKLWPNERNTMVFLWLFPLWRINKSNLDLLQDTLLSWAQYCSINWRGLASGVGRGRMIGTKKLSKVFSHQYQMTLSLNWLNFLSIFAKERYIFQGKHSG